MYYLPMRRDGRKIRLTARERADLSAFVAEPVDPQNVDDHNAWIEYAIDDLSDADPEQRLVKAALLAMKIAD